uniref:Tyrosine-protein kinase n=1 Tax=Steinernema glaseri TaxID=37863 RepID=A0A1I7ZZR1_9BILA
MIDPSLATEPFYHGLLPREDIKLMLKSNGDFLVRTTEPVAGKPRAIVISVMAENRETQKLRTIYNGSGPFILLASSFQNKLINKALKTQNLMLVFQQIKHFVVQRTSTGKYMIDKYGFDSVSDMIHHYKSTKESLVKTAEVIIRNPITRQSWELSHDDIVVTKKLGEGAFGEVSKGTLKLKDGTTIVVAIKLKTNLTPSQKMDMCLGAAWGLEYMHAKNVLHRDIAARNCLVQEGKIKLSDFGLSREGSTYQMDPKRRVPIRWLAPETLRTAAYSRKTDVWAFGIMCWEIFADGSEPYGGMTVGEVNGKVKAGYRMTLPDCTPVEMLRIVEVRCWSDSANDRWTMAEIARELERIKGAARIPKNDNTLAMKSLMQTTTTTTKRSVYGPTTLSPKSQSSLGYRY